MYGKELVQNAGFVMIPPADFNSAITGSAWIDMRQYGHATVVISVGETAGGTMAVTLNEGTTNAGAGEQTLAFTKIWSSGQRLNINTVSGTFVVGETLTQTSGNTNTAEIVQVSTDFLLVRNLTNGTTWGDGNTVTGGTSTVTAVMDGTGQDEDILLEKVSAPSSTFTIPQTTFKMYLLEIDASSLDIADGYRYIQVDIADPSGSTIAGGLIILGDPRDRGVPMPSALLAQKMAATF